MPIARPADQAPALVFRWPQTLTPGDGVTVTEGDCCVSMQHGRCLGIFYPGAHQLPAAIPDGVELWFCSTRPIVGRKFGGRLASGSVFGDYAYKVSAPDRFMLQIAGMGSTEGLEGFLDKTVLAAIGPTAPTPATFGEIQDAAAARLKKNLEPLGVSFLGFGTLQAS